ncbi:hypothetical protein SAMN00767673_1355 [Rubrobacter radiotolerans DSM 5868]|nr:hypothetical protein SAMN00767673_1355 [Rubrobacter radiotolerans DSM 5868]
MRCVLFSCVIRLSGASGERRVRGLSTTPGRSRSRPGVLEEGCVSLKSFFTSGRGAATRAVCAALVLVAFLGGCTGEVDELPETETAQQQTTTVTETTIEETVPETTAGGDPVGVGQEETRDEERFVLSEEQPVPEDFRAAYGRGAAIAVVFYGTSLDPFYPQGLSPDERVRSAVEGLSGEYPTVEFFLYDIDSPGDVGAAVEGAPLGLGEYGTLAAQLNVGYTPFVVTMAPSGEGYLILNRYQGYVPEPVISQALYDLSRVQVADNSSDVQLQLDVVRLTAEGGGVEYFTVSNASPDPIDLQGFSLRVVDPETGEVTTASPGVRVEESVEVPADGLASVGRVPDVSTDEGEPVDAAFTGGQPLDLVAGDQVALLDSGGAIVASTVVS